MRAYVGATGKVTGPDPSPFCLKDDNRLPRRDLALCLTLYVPYRPFLLVSDPASDINKLPLIC